MQIIDYIPHARYKITVFKSGNRFIVKFDDADHDLAIKFREGEVNNLQEVANQVNPRLLAEVDGIFVRLSSFRIDRYKQANESFQDII